MTLSSKNKGIVIILSAPSGCGKSTIAKALIDRDNNLRPSISATTRLSREGEIEGVNYYFKTKEQFEQLIKQDIFLEYTIIYGNYYGTLKLQVEQLLENGLDVIFAIDREGAKVLKSQLPEAITIFLLPPNLDVLEQRINSRGLDSASEVKLRMESAAAEMAYSKEYDYVVVNDNFTDTIIAIQSIIKSAKAAK